MAPSKIIEKPHVVPSKIVAITPPSEVIVISPTKTTSIVEKILVPPRRLKKSSSDRLAKPISQPLNAESGVPTFVPLASTMGSVKSWIIPEIQGIEDTLPRDRVTTLEAQHIASVSITSLSFHFSLICPYIDSKLFLSSVGNIF